MRVQTTSLRIYNGILIGNMIRRGKLCSNVGAMCACGRIMYGMLTSQLRYGPAVCMVQESRYLLFGVISEYLHLKRLINGLFYTPIK